MGWTEWLGNAKSLTSLPTSMFLSFVSGFDGCVKRSSLRVISKSFNQDACDCVHVILQCMIQAFL